MKLGEVFAAAKPFLSDGAQYDYKTQYICYALREAYFDGIITHQKYQKATGIISDRLSPCESVEEWLLEEEHLTNTLEYYEQLQAYRHRWLDELIREFS